MKINNISSDLMQYIISRLINEANDSLKESKNDPKNDFLSGRKEAYYEMLDIIKSELYAHDIDVKQYGLDIDLEKFA